MIDEYDLELDLSDWLRYGGLQTFGQYLETIGYDIEEPGLSEPDFIKAYALIRERLCK